jgi:hypothetical protein
MKKSAALLLAVTTIARSAADRDDDEIPGLPALTRLYPVISFHQTRENA